MIGTYKSYNALIIQVIFGIKIFSDIFLNIKYFSSSIFLLFRKLGVSEDWEVNDVYGLEENIFLKLNSEIINKDGI